MNEFKAYYQSLLDIIRQSQSEGVLAKKIHLKMPPLVFENLKGERVKLGDFKGKIVVLDFWATWCKPCVASFSSMKKIIQQYQNNKDVVFLFANTFENDTANRAEKLHQFLQKKGYEFAVLLDRKHDNQYQAAALLNIKSIPTQFIINKKGIALFNHHGYNGLSDAWIQELRIMIDYTLAH